MTARRKGSAMLEFALVGIPTIFLIIAVFEVSMIMWQYHSLAEAVAQAARYAAAHGQSCHTSPNTCGITVYDVATAMENQAVGLLPARITITLSTSSDSYGPFTVESRISPSHDTTAFPPNDSSAAAGSPITIAATYAITNPLYLFWTGTGTLSAPAYTLGATSTQEIL